MNEASDSLTFWDPTVIACLYIMGITILTYDYLCTLEQEVAYVWPCPSSFGVFLFYLNRYLPFIDQPLSLYLRLSINSSETCSYLSKWVIWFFWIGLFTSQLIITLRTCAIWGTKRCVTMPLLALTLGTAAFTVYQTVLQMNSAKFVGGEARGCQVKPESGKSFDLLFVPIFISDCVAITLTAIKAHQHFRRSSSSWLDQFYREGILYCMFILGLGIVNVISPNFSVSQSSYYKAIMQSPTRVFHSIFCNRVMLLILKQRQSSNHFGQRPAYSGETMQIFSTVQMETITSDCTDKISIDR